MRKNLFFAFLIASVSLGFSQSTVLLEEGFDDIMTLEFDGWTFMNESEPLGTTDWFQGNPTVFTAYEGDPDSYIGANFNSTTGSGDISTWLITPVLEVKDGDVLSFYTRTTSTTEWNDTMEIRLSEGTIDYPSGAMDVGSFTNVLLTINEDYDLSYPTEWTRYEVVVDGVGATPVEVYFAFRYHVINGGPSGTDSNYIGIDSVLVESDGTIGIDDQTKTVFTFFPNPARDLLTIQANKEVASVTVFNLLGQEVLTAGELAAGQVNVSGITAGSYMAQVLFEDGSKEVFKFVKQ